MNSVQKMITIIIFQNLFPVFVFLYQKGAVTLELGEGLTLSRLFQNDNSYQI